MSTNKASKNAMEKILKGEIKQRSRWYFLFHNALLWAFGSFSVLAGALIVSLMIFTLMNCDAHIHKEVYGYTLPRVTILLIGVWLLLTGGLVILFDLSVRRTKRGYIYPLWMIVVIDLLLSMVFGSIFYFAGMSAYIDEALGSRVDQYYSLEKRREMLFNKPNQGLLVGRVSHIENDNVQIVTSDQDMWVVFTHELPKGVEKQIQEGENIVFAGEKKSEGVFVACDARIATVQGIHQDMLKRYVEHMHKVQEEHKRILLERTKQRPADTSCEKGAVWRIRVQQ